MMSDSYGASSGPGSREPDQQAVPAVPASIPRAMIAKLRAKAKEFEVRSLAKRHEANDLNLRASEMYDAFISFDLLADKLEAELASAIETGTAKTEGLGPQDESAAPQADAQPSSEPTP